LKLNKEGYENFAQRHGEYEGRQDREDCHRDTETWRKIREKIREKIWFFAKRHREDEEERSRGR
jgi:hypothetical protein